MERGGPEEDSVAVYVVPKYILDMSERRQQPMQFVVLFLLSFLI